MAVVAHLATLESRVPFLHFFDGFRTSHEVSKIELIDEDTLRRLVDEDLITDHRLRALNPNRPVLRGTAQNPDVFFQAREAANVFYDAVPGVVSSTMRRIGEETGRRYDLFEYRARLKPRPSWSSWARDPGQRTRRFVDSKMKAARWAWCK